MEHSTFSGSHTSGRYFNFWQSDVNVAIGGSVINKRTYLIDQYRYGTKIVHDSKVKLWTTASGGTIGDGYGRYEPLSNAVAGQWQIGDQFCFDKGM